MGDLRVLESKTDCRKVIEDALTWVDNMECVMVVGIAKDGSQVLRTSTTSQMQKSFLVAFMNAWLAKWFRLENE